MLNLKIALCISRKNSSTICHWNNELGLKWRYCIRSLKVRSLYIYMIRYVYVLFEFCQTYLHFVMTVFDSWSFFNMFVVSWFDQLTETLFPMKSKWSVYSVCAYSAVQHVRSKQILLSVYGNFVLEFNRSTHLWHSLTSKFSRAISHCHKTLHLYE